MNLLQIRASINEYAVFTFSRSSGPGGQNVNKVNSKAELRIDLRLVEGVTELERAYLIEKLQPRLVDGCELVIQAQDTRSQLHNRELAQERAVFLIERALHKDKPRRPTKPTKASKERRINAKKKTGAYKQGRKSPSEE